MASFKYGTKDVVREQTRTRIENMSRRKTIVIGDLTIFPIGVGTSVGDFVQKAFVEMKKVPGIRIEPTGMSTIIEADNLKKLFSVVEKAHEAIIKMGAKRVYVVLKIDHRIDKPHNANYKLRRITGKE